MQTGSLHDIGGIGAHGPDFNITQYNQSTRGRKPIKKIKNGNWIFVVLTKAIEVVNDKLKIFTTASTWGILVSTLKIHLSRKSSTRKRERPWILTSKMEEELVEFVKQMVRIGHLLN